jgi:hypothetical protein
VALVTALAASIAAPARGDPTASLANAFALEQLVDVAQTNAFLRDRRCSFLPEPYAPRRVLGDPPAPAPVSCATPFDELDPLARPFVHSFAENLVAAALVNVALRTLARRSRAAGMAIEATASVYPVILISNARLGAGISFRL